MATQIKATSWVLMLIILHESEQTVFISSENANNVIQRHKRANFMLIEEILPGHLERECLEEVCVYEEAREYYEDRSKTDLFWGSYYGGKQCSSSPCLNNATCTNTIRSYKCSCAEGYKGTVCQFAHNECYPQMSDGCQQFCTPGYDSYHCSCASGYDLGEDDKSCIPKDPYACGRILRPDGGLQEKPTNPNTTSKIAFPWQVLLLDAENNAFCSGAIVNSNFVLTTAECTRVHSQFKVATGMAAAEHRRQVISVYQAHTHRRYSKEKDEHNIALLHLSKPIKYSNSCLPICIPEKDFAEQVLMPEQAGTVSGWRIQDEGGLGESPLQLQAYFLQKEMCEAMLNISQTNRRFCGRTQDLVNGTLASGGIFAAEKNGTWFLTGLMGSSSMQASDLKVLLFTKVSRYTTWFREIMD
ncbi:vitamin K-dependent protein Z [Ambystoma mexicanum]|uniref:vitamin K-dependent protein Z n=1 Tax=Ambystoma mexicanum TaxID=8296 RepID=UPI0037E7AF0D